MDNLSVAPLETHETMLPLSELERVDYELARFGFFPSTIPQRLSKAI